MHQVSFIFGPSGSTAVGLGYGITKPSLLANFKTISCPKTFEYSTTPTPDFHSKAWGEWWRSQSKSKFVVEKGKGDL